MTTVRFALSITSRLLLLALFAFAPRFLGAQVGEIKAESEVMPAEKTQGADENVSSLKLDIHNIQISRKILLEPLSESAKSALAPGAKDGPLLIGIGREMPLPYSDKVELPALEWIGLNGGGQAAALTVTSPGASALRLGLSVAAIADGIEIRFFSMETPERVFGPYTAKELLRGSKIQQADPFWSPVIEGDTIGMEIFLPEGRYPDELSFSIPKISHLWMSVLKSAQKRLSDIGSSGSCNVDIACNTQGWGTTGNSVVKYVWTSYPYVYMCTGTLLADNVQGTYIPYFLTANHCIGSQTNAANINTYWFFQRSTCGGAAPTSVTQQTGGATLLSHGTSADHSFMQLNDTPPGGAVFSGWSTGTVSASTSVVGIHHPQGDLKKISLGTASGYAPYTGSVDGVGDHTYVTWNSGVTEGGSSGSGIWISSGGSQYLVGTLHGGYSSCSTATEPDWYGRFDVAYTYISQWLSGITPTAQQLQNNVSVTNISGTAGSQQYYYIAVPSGTTSLTVTTTGSTGDMDLYVRFGSLPTLSTYDCRPYTSSSSESCTLSNPSAGNWYIMLNGYIAYSGLSLVASYSGTSPTSPDLMISSGTPTVTPSTIAPGDTFQLSAWTLQNQGGAISVVFQNGTYLSTDATITSSDTLLTYSSIASLGAGASYSWGAQTLSLPAGTAPGNYYIGILADRNNAVSESNESNNYVRVPITVIPPPCGVLQNGVPLANLSGTTGSQQNCSISVPSGATTLTVTISGGTGDVDLYVRFGSQPSTSIYDCRPYLWGNDESCTFTNPSAGDWHIMLNVYNAFSGLMLTASYFTRPPSQTLTLSSGGAASSNTGGLNGATWVGYSTVTVNSGSNPYGTAVFSFKQNGVTVTEAGVPASPPTTLARVFIDYRSGVVALPGQSNSGVVDINTGIAVVNTGTAIANVTYTLRNTAGNTLALGNGTIDAGTHFAKFISQLTDVAPNFNLPSDFKNVTQFGSLEIASDQPLSVLALRGTNNQRNDFLITTTPVADLTHAISYSPIYFPQFADGGGYTTSLVLLNTSNTTESGTLQILDRYGSPLVVNQVGGASNYSFRYSIPAGGAYHFQTDGSPAGINVGWVQLTPDLYSPTPVGSGVFSYNPGPMLISESGIPSAVSTTHARVYVDLSGDHNTGLAIANVGSSAASITLHAFQNNGVTPAGTSRGPLSLTAHGHDAEFADQFIMGLPVGFTGVLDISCSTPFAALTIRSLVNERDDFLMTTFPIADANAAAPSPIVFPQVVDGGGYATQVILISSSGASGTTLNYYDEDGTH